MRKGVISSVILAAVVATASFAQDAAPEDDEKPGEEQVDTKPPGFDEYFALTPEERQMVIRQMQKLKKADRTALPAPTILKPTTTIVDPRKMDIPPTVGMNSGYTTTLVFRDVTGQPWKVKDIFIDENRYQHVIPEGSEHLVVLQPKEDYVRGNVTVLLDGYDFPITINLAFDDSKVRFGRTLQVNDRGPNFQAPIVGTVSDLKRTSGHMVDFLDNIPPSTAEPVVLKGDVAHGMKAWRFDGHLYVRTEYTVLSPAYIEFQNSGDVKVYRLAPIPVLLVNDDGRTHQIRISQEVSIGR